MYNVNISQTTHLYYKQIEQVWPSKLEVWTKTCIPSTSRCLSAHQSTPSSAIIDLVGPLPLLQGCSYLLTLGSCYTHWPEQHGNIKSRAFITNWVARFSVPDGITPSQGLLYPSKLWNNMCNLFGITMKHTTA